MAAANVAEYVHLALEKHRNFGLGNRGPVKKQPGHLVTQLGYVSSSSSFRTKASAAVECTRLLVELTATHFLFDATSFDQLSEATDCLLNTLTVSNNKLYHAYASVE